MPQDKHDQKCHKTDNMINAMCDGLKPVKPLKPCKMMLVWFAISALLVVGMVWVVGMRHDAIEKMHETAFLAQAAALLVLAAITAYSGIRLGIPDSPSAHRIWGAVGLGAMAFWVIALGFAVVDVSASALMTEAESGHFFCSAFIIAAGAGAAVLMFVMLHDALPIRPCITGLAAAVAAATIGFVGSVFFCSMETPAHMAVAHMLPVLLVSLAFTLLARFFLKK